MRVMAQIAMVMNLDKCIGCHTCSVTCKQAWTNREGMEYVWFNNVETRPGVGYPRGYEDQAKWEGGWVRTKSGKLKPRAGGRLMKLATIFSNPNMPQIDDYYEPWTYEYENLLGSSKSKFIPVARPVSQLTGEPIDKIKWGSNWDDDLGGSLETMQDDPILEKMNLEVKAQIEHTFMFYLPRICNHCLNPACVASCPSGAMYKRTEDGIVLVDQAKCRGWRMCVSGCPYKKVYFNHKSGKAEKCTLCYPRLEVGQPTVCSETCVGRLRYLGVLLYDADRVAEAAAVEDEHDLYMAQRSILLDPYDKDVIAAAEENGVPHDWVKAAQQSPVYSLIQDYEVALPLHPEYRTVPMIWYIPPLSPVVDAVTASGNDGEDHKVLLTAIANMRIPMEYLAGLFTAGDTRPVEKSLRRLAAMRSYMRDKRIDGEGNVAAAEAVGMTGVQIERMYKLLAIAKYDDRYVIPTTSPETPRGIAELSEGPEFNEELTPLGKRAFEAVGVGAPAECAAGCFGAPPVNPTTNAAAVGRVNLLNWGDKK